MHPSCDVFEELISQLIETLHQELHQHRRLLEIVRAKKLGCLGGEVRGRETLLHVEKEILADLVTMQRDRIALLTELGLILKHRTPSRVRIAELVLHSSPEGRDELLDLRDEFRDAADEFQTLAGVEPAFSRHRAGDTRLFVDAATAGHLEPACAASGDVASSVGGSTGA